MGIQFFEWKYALGLFSFPAKYFHTPKAPGSRDCSHQRVCLSSLSSVFFLVEIIERTKLLGPG